MPWWKKAARVGGQDDPLSSSTAASPTPRKIFPSGIKLLFCPESSVVDIVFVHGLTGDRETTWTAHDASEPWPKALLPSKLPTARVLTFGYDAYVADWRGVVSQNRIANHAWNLLTSLALYREDDDTNERPVIFVCHSLGGLVCEDALATSKQRPERHLQNIFRSTRGIAFLGTPHHGAGLARWAELLLQTIGVIKQTNTEIVEVLKRDSEVLARVQETFHTMVMARSKEGQPIEITCFHEELPLPGLGAVVPKDSAILPGYILIGIHAHHMDMTKFATVDDAGFVAVCGELRRWVREITKVESCSTNSRAETGYSLSKIFNWIAAPRDYATILREALDRIEAGTAQCLFDQPLFAQWRKEPAWPGDGSPLDGHRLIWIHGHPGSGKTTLAASTVHSLKASTTDVFYFFFRFDNPLGRNTIHACRSLLFQMLHRHKTNLDLVKKFTFVVENGDSLAGELKLSSMAPLKDLLSLCLVSLDDPTIILDGVDECEDSDELADTVNLLMRIPALKIVVFSRPNVPSLQCLIKEEDRLYFGQLEIEADIRIYIKRHLQKMVEQKLLQPRVDIDECASHLVVGADKMFLWARLMVSYLQSPALSPSRREKMMRTMVSPDGLEAMYDRIFNLISQSPRPQQQLATGILAWLIYGRQPARMTVEDLAVAAPQCVDYDGHDDDDDEDGDDLSQPWDGFRDVVPVVTCGLVTIRGGTNLLAKSLHLSTVDYIKHWKPTGSIVTPLDLLRPGRYTAHLELAVGSLQLILQSARRRHLPKSASLTVRYPFMTVYAASEWPRHLGSATTMDARDIWDLERYGLLLRRRLQPVLSAFLATPNAVATFIEAWYTEQARSLGSGSGLVWVLGYAKKWANWLQQTSAFSGILSPDICTALNELDAFCDDMIHFADQWEEKVIRNPSILWDDALIFNTSRFLPQCELGRRVTFVPQKEGLGRGSSSRELCHISATSPDGRVIGLLSVWPSAQYESFWGSLDPDAAYVQVENFCHGWFARYELRSTDGTYGHLSDVIIPLDPSEVALQMKQSFRHECHASWKTSFPTAISPDGLTLVILRTVYQISIKPRPHSSPSWQASVLPLHTIDGLQDKWTKSKLPTFNPSTLNLQHLPPALRLLSRDWYRYSTTFSADSRYLLFSDHFKAFTGHLVLFRILDGGAVQLVANTTFHCVKAHSIRLTTFHPVLTMLAFISTGHAYLWDYGDVKSQPIDIRPGLNIVKGDTSWLRDFSESSSEAIRASNPMAGLEIQGLSFSSCGKFCVISQGGLSEVIDLQSLAIRPIPRDETPSEAHEDLRTLRAGDCAAQVASDQPARSSKQPVLRSAQWEMDPSDPRPRRELIVTQNGLVSIQARDLDGAVRQSASLLELPAGAGVTDAVVFQRPDVQDELTIILNKPVQAGYDMVGKAPKEILPAIVRRDFSSVLVNDSYQNLRLVGESFSASGETPESRQGDELEDSHSQKRRRVAESTFGNQAC